MSTAIILATMQIINKFKFHYIICFIDLQVGIFTLPLFIITKLDPSLWNIEICKIYKFFGFFSIVSNVYVNVSIAIERFRCVVFKSTYNYVTIVINILLFYICSFAISFTELQNYEITYPLRATLPI